MFWHYSAVPCSLINTFLALLVAVSLGFISPGVAAAGSDNSLSTQREAFAVAWKLAKKRQFSKMRQYLPQLEGYPLLPYLLHGELEKFSAKRLPEAMRFIQDYPLFPRVESMRESWIASLARRGMWNELLQLAADDAARGSVATRCLVLNARLRLNQLAGFVDDAMPIFLHGKSQPKQCDPVFAKLYKTVDQDVIWQRAVLAFYANQSGLARHLGRHLDGDLKSLLNKWLRMHANPVRELQKLPMLDVPENRGIAMYGIKRVADTRGVTRALGEFDKIRQKYAFTGMETDPVFAPMGRKAVRSKHRDMIKVLDLVQQADADTFEWQLVAALRTNSWTELLRWTANASGVEEVNHMQRLYWFARTLMQTGKSAEAKLILNELALLRDYYGFAAADLVNMPYQMNARKALDDAIGLERAAKIPVIARAREWLALDEQRQANREWLQARRQLDAASLEYAANLAHQWQWYYGSVLALGAAEAFAVVELRFPVLYKDSLTETATKRNLDRGWLFGLIRSESLFVEDIRSPAGALGLMQVMPATGRLVARKIGLRPYSTNMLKKAKYNVLIGSNYLKEMYDMFNGNVIYATAAYNAGPNRVVRWDKRTPCAAADVWTEIIPFSETRKYVKNVLFYSSIYDWLLQQPITSMRNRAGSYWQSDINNCTSRSVPVLN